MLISVHTLSFYENTQEMYFISQSIVFDYLLMTFVPVDSSKLYLLKYMYF